MGFTGHREQGNLHLQPASCGGGNFGWSAAGGRREKRRCRSGLQSVEHFPCANRDHSLVAVPMIPSALFAILAISRLGALHAVVFGGFAPASLAQRIDASKPKAVLTASCGVEGAKGAMDYKPFLNSALQLCKFQPEKIIIWQRDQARWDPIIEEKGERDWQSLVKSARNRGLKANPVPIKSHESLYIIYTSGECHRGVHVEPVGSDKPSRSYEKNILMYT